MWLELASQELILILDYDSNLKPMPNLFTLTQIQTFFLMRNKVGLDSQGINAWKTLIDLDLHINRNQSHTSIRIVLSGCGKDCNSHTMHDDALVLVAMKRRYIDLEFNQFNFRVLGHQKDIQFLGLFQRLTYIKMARLQRRLKRRIKINHEWSSP